MTKIPFKQKNIEIYSPKGHKDPNMGTAGNRASKYSRLWEVDESAILPGILISLIQ